MIIRDRAGGTTLAATSSQARAARSHPLPKEVVARRAERRWRRRLLAEVEPGKDPEERSAAEQGYRTEASSDEVGGAHK